MHRSLSDNNKEFQSYFSNVYYTSKLQNCYHINVSVQLQYNRCIIYLRITYIYYIIIYVNQLKPKYL